MLKQFPAHIQETATKQKSLLDLAIEQYDLAAKNFYSCVENSAKAVEGGTPSQAIEVKSKRQEKLAQTKRHLEHQKMSLLAMAQVQADLDEYRAAGKAAVSGVDRKAQQSGLAALHEEKHHGTGLTTLEKYLQADARPRPSKSHSAHHIIPGKGRKQTMGRATRNYAYQARALLHTFGIRINDPDNGVWLPRSVAELVSYAMPDAKAHKQYHTNAYEEYVYRAVRPQRTESAFRDRLRALGRELQSNTLKLKRPE